MKIAILHEMLIKKGGAEKVVSELLNIFPEADFFTLIYDEKQVGSDFTKEKIHPQCFSLPSQKVYSFTKKQRLCLPFMKRSVEKLDFSDYDRVIVSSSGFAHGLKTRKETKTLVYYHAPARYMWDWAHEYRRDIHMTTGVKGYIYGKFMKNLRMWDYEVSQKNDVLLANSTTTQKRLQKYYRKTSTVLYPPIETARFAKKLEGYKAPKVFFNTPYYIILSALSEFKKLDIAIQAVQNMGDINLLIIGAGEYRENLEKISNNAENIAFAGAQYGDDLVYLVQNSLGLIFPGEEDFGIVPIEIMAAGKPIFALQKGGLTETVLAGKTGDFFQDPEGGDFITNFKAFHKKNISGNYSEKDCKEQAQKYDRVIFSEKIKEYVT